MMNCVDNIENKLSHISDILIWDIGFRYSRTYVDRTDVQLTTSSDVFQIKLDSI